MDELTQIFHKPSPLLRPYVSEILLIRSNYQRTQLLLPETNFTMLIRLAGRGSLHGEELSPAIVSGLQTGSRMVGHTAGSSVIVIRFTALGAPAVLHDRADLLYGRTAPLDTVLPSRELGRLREMLMEKPEPPMQLALVENFLERRVALRNAISPQMEAAIRAIRASAGTASVASIARQAAMSQSSLERHFRAVAGATPKVVSRLVRLQNVLRLWQRDKRLTEVAFEAGYCDQPHMVHDFRLLTGFSPEEFFRASISHNLTSFYK